MAGTITALTVTLKGKVPDSTTSLTMDGTAVPLDNGAWSVEVPATTTAHTYIFTTIDGKGRATSRAVTVERLTAAPV